MTAVTQRLLEHWRHHDFGGPRPFFCQIEAVETIIWLTEVAPKRAVSKGLLDQIAKANEEANPELFRLAMKMATGSGKTTVMAMLIAWQAVNAARKESKDFSRAFLIVAPGITIKDRLRVLQPSEPDNYYETREIVPPEMLPEIRRAEIVITNYHAFQHRETLALPKVARSFLQGNDPPLKTTETDADMLKRACEKLLNYDRVNVINDEAHHCYRHKVGGDAEGALTGDDKKEAAENEEAARLWINGIEALDRKLSKGVRAVYDLSATPFLPPWLRLRGRHALPMGRVRLQPDGRDRERHREAAARAGDRQSGADRYGRLPRLVEAHRQGPAENRRGRRQAQPLRPAQHAEDRAERALQPL